MSKPSNCKAVKQNDEFFCAECGLRWSASDDQLPPADTMKCRDALMSLGAFLAPLLNGTGCTGAPSDTLPSEPENLKYSAGTTILFTQGCYEDFCTAGIVTLVEDCDFRELGAEYAEDIKDAPEYDRPGFAYWLCNDGHASFARVEEVHLDDGYNFDLHER